MNTYFGGRWRGRLTHYQKKNRSKLPSYADKGEDTERISNKEQKSSLSKKEMQKESKNGEWEKGGI